MMRALLALAALLVLAALVLFVLAIWSGDTRWGMTGVVLLLPGTLGVVVLGSGLYLTGDDR